MKLILILIFVISTVSCEDFPLALSWQILKSCVRCLESQGWIFVVRGDREEWLPCRKVPNQDGQFFALHFVANVDFCGCRFVTAPYSGADMGCEEHSNDYILTIVILIFEYYFGNFNNNNFWFKSIIVQIARLPNALLSEWEKDSSVDVSIFIADWKFLMLVISKCSLINFFHKFIK